MIEAGDVRLWRANPPTGFVIKASFVLAVRVKGSLGSFNVCRCGEFVCGDVGDRADDKARGPAEKAGHE